MRCRTPNDTHGRIAQDHPDIRRLRTAGAVRAWRRYRRLAGGCEGRPCCPGCRSVALWRRYWSSRRTRSRRTTKVGWRLAGSPASYLASVAASPSNSGCAVATTRSLSRSHRTLPAPWRPPVSPSADRRCRSFMTGVCASATTAEAPECQWRNSRQPGRDTSRSPIPTARVGRRRSIGSVASSTTFRGGGPISEYSSSGIRQPDGVWIITFAGQTSSLCSKPSSNGSPDGIHPLTRRVDAPAIEDGCCRRVTGCRYRMP